MKISKNKMLKYLKGVQHEVKVQNGQNYCKNCGLHFDVLIKWIEEQD